MGADIFPDDDIQQVAVALGAATPHAVPGASGNIVGSASILMGWSLHETAGAAAVVHIRDGASGTILAPITFVAGESIRDWFGPNGVKASTAIYFELVSGAVEGAVFTR